MRFEPDEGMNTVSPRMRCDGSNLMLFYALTKIVCHPNIDRALCSTGKDVDKIGHCDGN